MKKLSIFPLILWLMSLTTYCQVIQVTSQDTNICFSIPDARILLIDHYKGQEWKELNLNCEQTSFYQVGLISTQKELLSNKDTIIRFKDGLIESLVVDRKKADRHSKWMKTQRNGLLITSILTGIVAGVEYLVLSNR